MAISDIKEEDARVFYYEDIDGNFIKAVNGVAIQYPVESQHILFPVVEQSKLASAHSARWPVAFLNWIINKMPYSWQRRGPHRPSRNYNLCDSSFEIIKYFVDTRRFSFRSAAVIAGTMCQNCEESCLAFVKGRPPPKFIEYFGACNYCDIISPGSVNKFRAKACYSTFKYGGDVARAYREVCVNGKYGTKEVKYSVTDKIKIFLGKKPIRASNGI